MKLGSCGFERLNYTVTHYANPACTYVGHGKMMIGSGNTATIVDGGQFFIIILIKIWIGICKNEKIYMDFSEYSSSLRYHNQWLSFWGRDGSWPSDRKNYLDRWLSQVSINHLCEKYLKIFYAKKFKPIDLSTSGDNFAYAEMFDEATNTWSKLDVPAGFPKYWKDFLHAPAQDGQVEKIIMFDLLSFDLGHLPVWWICLRVPRR